MATTDYNVKFDLKIINHIKPFLPKEYKSWQDPNVLFSGDQKKIEKWRMEKSIEITKKKRPDLL